jgi:hypothetical protein
VKTAINGSALGQLEGGLLSHQLLRRTKENTKACQNNLRPGQILDLILRKKLLKSKIWGQFCVVLKLRHFKEE